LPLCSLLDSQAFLKLLHNMRSLRGCGGREHIPTWPVGQIACMCVLKRQRALSAGAVLQRLLVVPRRVNAEFICNVAPGCLWLTVMLVQGSYCQAILVASAHMHAAVHSTMCEPSLLLLIIARVVRYTLHDRCHFHGSQWTARITWVCTSQKVSTFFCHLSRSNRRDCNPFLASDSKPRIGSAVLAVA
jgi:hypothetical protein